MNPLYAFNGPKGGGGKVYITIVNKRDSIQGIVNNIGNDNTQ
jgi:hypothetical protein